MDLQTAVGVSMLPVYKARAAAAFREIRAWSSDASLEAVVVALGLTSDVQEVA
jgi:hypothetical protein